MSATTYWTIPTPSKLIIEQIDKKVEVLVSRLDEIISKNKHIKFASSLAVEDMVITDVIAKHHHPIQIFLLETGKLPKETLELIPQIIKKYQLDIQMYYPIAEKVTEYKKVHGQFAFYESIELRKECCFIRKIEPLNRALQNADAWLTGQRRDQAVTRSQLHFAEIDTQRNINKYNPIFDWSEEDVWAYILRYQVPYNKLYLSGYPSIGCDPCTRPIKANEDIRAGRWWWEQKDSKECGLHQN